MISTKKLGISIMKWIYTILIKRKACSLLEVLHKEAWVAKLLGTHLSIQVHKT